MVSGIMESWHRTSRSLYQKMNSHASQSIPQPPKDSQESPKLSTEFRNAPHQQDSSEKVNFRRQSLSGLNTSFIHRILIIFPFPFKFFRPPDHPGGIVMNEGPPSSIPFWKESVSTLSTPFRDQLGLNLFCTVLFESQVGF